jgi:hypothetical protein
VNGRDNALLSYGCKDELPTNCISTSDADVDAWWLVDLEKRYTLTGVKFMPRQRVNGAYDGKTPIYRFFLNYNQHSPLHTVFVLLRVYLILM